MFGAGIELQCHGETVRVFFNRSRFENEDLVAAWWYQATRRQHKYIRTVFCVQFKDKRKISCVLQEKTPVGDLI